MRDAYMSFIGVVTLLIALALVTVIVKGNGVANLLQSFSSAFDSLLSHGTGKT